MSIEPNRSTELNTTETEPTGPSTSLLAETHGSGCHRGTTTGLQLVCSAAARSSARAGRGPSLVQP
eukprot:898296-Alexandrium_andersonii.AAC.1